MLVVLLAAALQAATAAAPVTDKIETIVVTATMAQLKDALDRCKAGGCTPRQDIVASIRYAEATFRAGRYLDARQTLQEAIARDRHAAQGDPMALSALYEATTTVALHDGDQDVARRAGGARMKLLRDHYGADDPRLLQAELDEADTLMGTNQQAAGAARYPVIARRAAAAHLPAIQAAAVMRQALVAHADRSEQAATRLLTQLIDDPGQLPVMRIAARALLARFARDRGNSGPADALVTSFLADGGSGPPVLVWQPPLPTPLNPFRTDPFVPVERNPSPTDASGAEWADIGFLIRPDGTVDSPEVLRGTRAQVWSEPIRTMIAQRRYLPGKADAPPAYRIERWTYTADYCAPTGSLIRQRACRPHYVQLDLTPEPPKPPAS